MISILCHGDIAYFGLFLAWLSVASVGIYPLITSYHCTGTATPSMVTIFFQEHMGGATELQIELPNYMMKKMELVFTRWWLAIKVCPLECFWNMYVYNAYSTLIYIHIIICMYIDIGISLDGGWFLLGILPTRVIRPKSGESTKKWLGKGGFLSSGKPGIYWSKHKNTHAIIEKAGKPPDDRPSTLGIPSFNEGQTRIKYRELKNDAAELWFHFLLPPGIKHGNGKCTLIYVVCWIFH